MLLNPATNRSYVGKNFFDGFSLFRGPVKIAAAQSVFDHELYVWLRLCPLSLIFSNAKFSDVLVGIRVVGKNQYLDFEILGEENFDRLLCCLNACSVAIIVDYNFARKPT